MEAGEVAAQPSSSALAAEEEAAVSEADSAEEVSAEEASVAADSVASAEEASAEVVAAANGRPPRQPDGLSEVISGMRLSQIRCYLRSVTTHEEVLSSGLKKDACLS